MNFLNMFQNPYQRKTCAIFQSLFLFYVAINLAISSYLFFIQNFPDNYAWTELFINYKGGFIRRGLIGQILFFLSYITDTRIATALLFLPFYVFFIKFSLELFCKNCDNISLILIIVSPGLFFFFTQDQRMLCKKDLYYELGFIIQFLLLLRKDIKLHNLFIFLIIIYFICTLIHESTVFYSILPFSVFLEKANKEKQFFRYFCILVVLVVISIIYLITFSGTVAQSKQIFSSWLRFFPLSEVGAIRYIGMPLSIKLAEEKIYYNSITLIYICLGMLLTALPLVCYIVRTHALYRVKIFFESNFNRLIVFFGFIVPWILPFIAIDFGRHIHTAIFNQLAFVAAVISLTGGIGEIKNNQKLHFSKTAWIAIFVYAFGWKLWHFAACGNIVTFSFPIRIFTVGWLSSLNP